MNWWRRSKVLSPRSRMMISFCPVINDTIKRFALFINNRAKYWEIVEAKFILRIVVWVSTVTTDVYSISVYTYTHTRRLRRSLDWRGARWRRRAKTWSDFFFSYCYHQRRLDLLKFSAQRRRNIWTFGGGGKTLICRRSFDRTGFVSKSAKIWGVITHLVPPALFLVIWRNFLNKGRIVGFLRRPQKFDEISILVLTLLSNIKTKMEI